MNSNFDHSKLRGKIKEKFGSESSLSKEMGLSPTSISYRLNNIVEFSSTEIYRLIVLLDLPGDKIKEYFFEEKVCKKQTKRTRYTRTS